MYVHANRAMSRSFMRGTARKRLPLIVIAAILAMVGAVGTAEARTYVNNGSGKLVVKPKTWVGGSGVGGGTFYARNLKWKKWRKGKASATGTLKVNTCDPTCADGNYKHYRARFYLYRARRGCRIFSVRSGKQKKVSKRIFTRVNIHFSGAYNGVWKTTPMDGFRC